MKSVKWSWLVAGMLSALLAVVWFKQTQEQRYPVRIYLSAESVEFKVPNNPVIFYQPGSKIGATKQRVNLAADDLMTRQAWSGLNYTLLQPGLYLLNLGDTRVFVFGGEFEPENLDPSLPVDFNSDWVVLDRASLLPENWPVPKQGWVVMSSRLTERLESLSIEAQKPVVQPHSAGPLELRLVDSGQWQVLAPGVNH